MTANRDLINLFADLGWAGPFLPLQQPSNGCGREGTGGDGWRTFLVGEVNVGRVSLQEGPCALQVDERRERPADGLGQGCGGDCAGAAPGK